MACIFDTVLLDLSAAMTDSFEERGLIRGGLIGGFRVDLHNAVNLKRETQTNKPSFPFSLSRTLVGLVAGAGVRRGYRPSR